MGPKSSSPSRWVFRLGLLCLALAPLLFLDEFWMHFEAHLTGAVLSSVITGQWHIVALNIAVFLSFLLPLGFRRRASWGERGLVAAFFISLFVEMYGIPLTVMFAAGSMSPAGVDMPGAALSFRFLGVGISMTNAMVYGAMLMAVGTLLIAAGWYTLYRSVKLGELATTGAYSYSRHPQYLGFILLIIGWIVGWPTLLTLVFGPVLILVYLRLCRTEERELEHEVNYREYKEITPFLM